MENNKDNQGTSASRADEKTVHPTNNSERDYVNQTGKSQNMGNDSDYLTDPNSKGKPETLAEGSEFLNDVIEENNPSSEKENDTKEFYNHADTMTGNSNTGNSNPGNSSWSTGNSDTTNSGTNNSGLSTENSGTNEETDEDEFGPETGNSGNQNYKDQAPKSYNYVDQQDQQDRNSAPNMDEDEDEDTQDADGKVNSAMIVEDKQADVGNLDEMELRTHL